MHSAGFGVFLAVACLVGVYTFEMHTYCPGVIDRAKTCFTSQGLPYDESNIKDDALYVFNGVKMLDKACSNIPSFNQAIACTGSEVKKCLGAYYLLLPSTNNTIQYFEFLCRRKDEIDAKCADTKLEDDNEPCQEETFKALQPTQSSRELSLSQALCLSTEVTYDCTGKVLETCGKNTKVVFQEGLNNYLSDICSEKPGRPGRKPFTYPLLSSASALSQSVAVFVISLLMSLIFHL